MGVDSSVLTDDDLQRLKGETDIKQKDIKKCHKKFKSLDKDKTVDEFKNQILSDITSYVNSSKVFT